MCFLLYHLRRESHTIRVISTNGLHVQCKINENTVLARFDLPGGVFVCPDLCMIQVVILQNFLNLYLPDVKNVGGEW